LKIDISTTQQVHKEIKKSFELWWSQCFHLFTVNFGIIQTRAKPGKSDPRTNIISTDFSSMTDIKKRKKKRQRLVASIVQHSILPTEQALIETEAKQKLCSPRVMYNLNSSNKKANIFYVLI